MTRVEEKSQAKDDDKTVNVEIPLEVIEVGSFLVKYFNKSELKELGFELGLDDENLEGETKNELAISLVKRAWRHGLFLKLNKLLQQKRPEKYKKDVESKLKFLFQQLFIFFFPEVTIVLKVTLPPLNPETERLVTRGICCLLCSLLSINFQNLEEQVKEQVKKSGQEVGGTGGGVNIQVNVRVPRTSALKLKNLVKENREQLSLDLPGFEDVLMQPSKLDNVNLTSLQQLNMFRKYQDLENKINNNPDLLNSLQQQISQVKYLMYFDDNPSLKQSPPVSANNTLSAPSITPPLSPDPRPDFSYSKVTNSGTKQEIPVLDQTNFQPPIPRLDAVLPGLLEEALQDKPQIPEPKFKETLPIAVIGHSDFDLAYKVFMGSLENAPDSKFVKRGDVITKRNDGLQFLG